MKRILLYIAVVVLLIGGYLAYTYYFRLRPIDYVIQGVPYVGISSPLNIGNFSHYAGVMSMVFNYWGDTRWKVTDLLVRLPPEPIRPGEPIDLSDLAQFANEQNYNAYISTGKEIRDLEQYINSKVRTPVIVRVDMAPDYTASTWQVVYGILESKKEVIVHDYFFGNSRTLSFDYFLQVWGYPKSRSRPFAYLIVQPKDLEGALREKRNAVFEYPPTDPVFGEIEEAERLYVTGAGFVVNKQSFSDATKTLLRLISHPQFPKLPPYQRIMAYTYLAESYLKTDEIAKAKESIRAAEDLNQNLKQPTPPWPPAKNADAPADKLSSPFFVRAEIQIAEQDRTAAIKTLRFILNLFKDPSIVSRANAMLADLTKSK